MLIVPDEYQTAKILAEGLLHGYAAAHMGGVTQEAFDLLLERAAREISEQERERLRYEMETKFNVFVPDSQTLLDKTDHIEWMLGAKSGINWDFWGRYRIYLQHEKHLPPSIIQKADELTDEILGHLENPKRGGIWERHGLVVGQVQSGKTANYTGLICKAVDAGYKLVIVLAGMHNSLRSQTQLRLDEGFLGRDTNQFRVYREDSPLIGVGKLPGNSPDAIPLTTSHERGDFKRRTAESMSLPIGTIPVIVIVKKHPAILRHLLVWIEGNIAQKRNGSKVVPGEIPLLLIDDEADNASVNTLPLRRSSSGGYDDVQRLTSINSLIRKLLHGFERRAYVGYTATPFANIFIPQAPTIDEGKDLFPESFIVNLRPPSNYIGPVEVFGLNTSDEFDDGMPVIREITDADTVFPTGHRKDMVVSSLPPSLHEAIRAFFLTCAARRARGHEAAHNSMLIHVTRFQDVQTQVANQVKDIVEGMKARVAQGDGSLSPSLIDELRFLWERDFEPTTAMVRERFADTDKTLTLLSWDDVKDHIYPASVKIKVKTINGSSADALEYYENNIDGLSVIAVGGDKLSRGLTLEGLSVSYYLRATQMYDTLMQMGRWFGYRTGYADLCRLYTSTELVDWYRHITVASEELRNEFDEMARLRLTPKDFGLKVQTHPGSLAVTGAGKSRYGQRIRMSYRGQLIESYRISKEARAIDDNLETLTALITAADAVTAPQIVLPKASKEQDKPRALVWKGLPVNLVTDFLRAYKSGPDTQFSVPSHASNPDRQADFINTKATRRGELISWTVVLCSATGGRESTVCGHQIGLIQRIPAKDSLPEDGIYRIRKNRIIDPDHELLDLTEAEVQEAISLRQGSGREANMSAGQSARRVRPPERGLLLLYPLDPLLEKQDKADNKLHMIFPPGDPRRVAEKPMIGFALSFSGYGYPDKYLEDSVEYLVNPVFIENESEGFVEDEEEGDNEDG